MDKWLLVGGKTVVSLALFALTGCIEFGDPNRNRPPNVLTPVHITFMHMNDLHAHLVPHDDLVRTGATAKIEKRGGIARLATKIKEIRAENPVNVLVNVGDTFHGGVEARFTLGNAIVEPVNALGIDIGVPGNWDFAFDVLTFNARFAPPSLTNQTGSVKRPNYLNLAANMTNALGNHPLPPIETRYIDGIWVGFIGLTSDIVPLMHPALSLGFGFTTGEQNYVNLINGLARKLRDQQKAAVVVVLSELGIHKNKRLADAIDPGLVDVFFTGHTHEATFTPLTSASGALVVEAGNDGYLGRMDIHLDNAQIVRQDWQLIPLDATVAEDPAMQLLVEQARAPFFSADVNMVEPNQFSEQTLSQPIDTVVGKTELILDRRHALEHTFNNTFTDWLKAKANTRVAITPGFRFDSVVPGAGYMFEDATIATGDITLEDVYRFIPVHFTMGLAESTGIHLKRTLEKALSSAFSQDSFAQNGGFFAGISGVSLQVDLAKPDGFKITSMTFKDTGAEVTDTSVFSVAGCIRPMEFKNKLCSFEGFSKFVHLINPATTKPYTGTDFLIESLQTNVINVARNDVQDISGVQMWPQSDYMQPIGLVP